ncbi:MAG: hypothetical protein WCI51_00935 [Lentisphaerota bacterium]
MFSLVTENWPEVKSAVEALALPPAWKRRLVSRLGRMLIAQSQKNVRTQQTIDGSSMAPRKRMPGKERRVYHKDGSVTYKKVNPLMLSDMVKSKWLGMKLVSDDEALVHFFRGVGYVAYKHQYGGKEAGLMRDAMTFPRNIEDHKINLTAARQTLESGKTGCSPRQAVMLMRLGWEQDQDWIMSHVSGFAAAKIIKSKQDKVRPGQVQDNTPARPFLGVRARQMAEFREFVLASLNEKFRAKNFQGYR